MKRIFWKTNKKICTSLLVAAVFFITSQYLFGDFGEIGTSSNVINICSDIERKDVRILFPNHQNEWQLQTFKSSNIILYSAFFDDRQIMNGSTFIRILGVSSYKSNLYCLLWFAELRNPISSEIKVVKNGKNQIVEGIHLSQIMFSCQIPYELNTLTISHVSISSDQCSTSTILLPIIKPRKIEPMKGFAICVPIAFGSIDPSRFVEWVELNKLYGISHIFVYNGTLSNATENPNMHKTFANYIKQGFLTVFQIPPPVPVEGKMGAKLASPASINDCMLRYMYSYKFLAFIDFDELIVPKNSQDYESLINEINTAKGLKSDWISYTFRNTLFLDEFEHDNSTSSSYHMLRYRKHAKPGGALWAPKSMIDPRNCLSAFNHYCYIRFPHSVSPFTIDVSPSIAQSNHYRACSFGKTKCKELMNVDVQTDDTLLQHTDKIEEAFGNARKYLNFL